MVPYSRCSRTGQTDIEHVSARVVYKMLNCWYVRNSKPVSNNDVAFPNCGSSLVDPRIKNNGFMGNHENEGIAFFLESDFSSTNGF